MSNQYTIIQERSQASRFIKSLLFLIFFITILIAAVVFFYAPYAIDIFKQGTDPQAVSQNTNGEFIIQQKTYKSYEEFYALFTQDTNNPKAKGGDPILEYTNDFYNLRSEYYDRCEAKQLEISFTKQKTASVTFNYKNEIIEYNVNVYNDLYEFTDNLKNQDCYFKGEYVNGYFRDPYNEEFMSAVANDLANLKGTYTEDELVEIAALFSQSIPYGTDETQINRFPYETFFEGEGNCLDKSVILIYLLEKLNYTSYIVLGQSTEYHALVGVECSEGANIKVDEKNVCFIETTVFQPIGTPVDITVEKVVPMSQGTKIYKGTNYGPQTVKDIEITKQEVANINQNIQILSENLKLIETDMCTTDCVICNGNSVDFQRSKDEIITCSDAGIYNSLVAEYNTRVKEYNSLIAGWYERYHDIETWMFENIEIVERK